jgi:transcriptional regulator with XRE-family HTH domain
VTKNLAQTVPALLRAELARRDIARGDFAERLGVSSTWLYRRLSGTVEMTLSDLELMTNELGITPEEVVAARDVLVQTGASPDRGTGQGSPTTQHPSDERNGQ